MNSDDLTIRNDQLTPELLESFPVWGAYDDDDSEIIRPVQTDAPFATDCDPLTIKAKFATTNNRSLSGCVVVDRAFDEVYLIEVFVLGKWFGFNRHLPDIAQSQLAKLASALGESENRVFPLRFTTGVTGPTKEDFEGVFSPFRQE